MSWFAGKKLLAPVDFSPQSEHAVDQALQMVADPAAVHVIHVAPALTALTHEVVWVEVSDETRQENIETYFKEQFGEGRYATLPFHVAFGDAGREIAAYAQEIGADLIVMPSHGRTGIGRLLLGSVAERVLRLAHCPVFVLKSDSVANS